MHPQCPGPKESWRCLKIGKPQISIHAHHFSHSDWKMSGNITACLEKHVLHQKRENCHDVQSFFAARRVARLALFRCELRARFGGGVKRPVVKGNAFQRILWGPTSGIDSCILPILQWTAMLCKVNPHSTAGCSSGNSASRDVF